MQAGNDDRRVEQTEDEAAEDTAVGVQPEDAIRDARSNDAHSRTNNDKSQEAGDKHCE